VDLADGLATIGYWVVSAARGRGIAPRALVTVTDWAIQKLGLHRLELEHSTRNPASCRVAEKAGYSLESTKRSQGLHADGWHDMHLHVRLEEGAVGSLDTASSFANPHALRRFLI
jgi:RimJ/RimL family protein N-acetyltransferase